MRVRVILDFGEWALLADNGLQCELGSGCSIPLSSETKGTRLPL